MLDDSPYVELVTRKNESMQLEKRTLVTLVKEVARRGYLFPDLSVGYRVCSVCEISLSCIVIYVHCLYVYHTSVKNIVKNAAGKVGSAEERAIFHW